MSTWHAPIKKQQKPPKPVINAQLLFIPKEKPKQPPIDEAKPIEESEPVEESVPEDVNKPIKQAPIKKEPKTQEDVTTSKDQPPAKDNTKPPKASLVQPQPIVSSSVDSKNPEEQATLTLPKGDGSYNPYASMQSVIEQDNQAMFNSVQISDQPQPSIKSINSFDDPKVKNIFKTAYRIGSNIRVINYNGKCVQVERKLDMNGFSYESWTGISGNCGQGDAMKKQFQLSMDKFTKPKKIK